MPKSLLAIQEQIAHVTAISCAYLVALDTASCMSTSSVSAASYVEQATKKTNQKEESATDAENQESAHADSWILLLFCRCCLVRVCGVYDCNPDISKAKPLRPNLRIL
jgi:hypothetical protein